MLFSVVFQFSPPFSGTRFIFEDGVPRFGEPREPREPQALDIACVMDESRRIKRSSEELVVARRWV